MKNFEDALCKNMREFQQGMRKAVMLLTLLLGQYCMAQTDIVFQLTKEHGHFFCETTLNGVNAKVMVESGVPGLMMSAAFYEAHKDSLQLDVKESDEKIRYLGGLRHIKYTAQGRLQIGGAFFEGPIKIIHEDHAMMIPIQMLHHPLDNSAIVRIDLGKSQLSVCCRKNIQNLSPNVTALNLTYNQFGMPVVTASLDIKADGQKVSITGKFITDMGNASLLFLNKSDTVIEKLVREGKLRLHDARDNRTGKVVAQGVYAEKLSICDRTYKGVSVGVSTFKSLTECGFLGLKFFTMPAVFDFDENKLYLFN